MQKTRKFPNSHRQVQNFAPLQPLSNSATEARDFPSNGREGISAFQKPFYNLKICTSKSQFWTWRQLLPITDRSQRSTGNKQMAQFWEGDKVGLTGTVTYVDDSRDPPLISLEIDGYTVARITLSANHLTFGRQARARQPRLQTAAR